MKINKIILYNFNSFEGENEFDFSCADVDRNIILIGGKNGAGKTSLFTAIKLALYGPLAFGYVGINPHYVTKVKECINSRAFQTDTVESRVQINISLMVEREIKEYEILRKWDYSKQKLLEDYSVSVNGQKLDDQELSYFQNYFQGLIPPDLFEFFLFDGEEVGSIFSTNTYNSYVRNAVYTLCGLDIFEIIRKYTRGYVGKASTSDEEVLYNTYEELRKSVETLEESKEKLVSELVVLQEAKEKIETELIEVETAFKNAGGVTETEKKALTQEYEEAERNKAECAAKIKLFVEGVMPFVIVKEFTGEITKQLDYEEKREIFTYVQQKINKKDILKVLSGEASEETVDALMDMLLKKFKPTGFSEKNLPIHDLSREETGRVNAMVSFIENFDVGNMIDIVNQKQKASDLTMNINKTLKSAMAEDDAAKFTERENTLLKKKEEINQRIFEDKTQIESLSVQIDDLISQRERAWQNVKDNAQNKHVLELSSGLCSMMDELISEKTVSIKNRLENLIVKNLQHIYRKNNLITHIEIDDDFQFNLYQDSTYTAAELAYLMKNLGKESFSLAIGKRGKDKLFNAFSVDSISSLQKALSYYSSEKIELFKKIDLSRLSKGERQIFILSLYWAIIELSGQDIPFVIDTPYARIDANHRKEISEKFFPNISKQVVILSTDEEINEEYYEILKPYIAKEYLLINDESQNRTSVENKYFFEA